MRYLVLILILVISIVMVIFGAQNTQTVQVEFFTYKTGQISLSLVIVLAALGGAALSGLVGVWSSIQSSLRERAVRRRLEARNRDLENQLQRVQKDYSAMRTVLQSQARTPPPASGEQKSSTR